MGRLILISMISILSVPALAASPVPAECRDASRPMILRDHMRCMTYFVDNMAADLNNQEAALAVANDLTELRRHMVAALAMLPSRIKGMKPEEARVKTLGYQIQLAETLGVVGKLELRLLTRPKLGDKETSDPVANQLAMRLYQMIGEGHQRFR